MEEAGRVRRGYFVAGLGATQFALPGAVDLLRSLRDAPDEPEMAVLAATDPANPYGATLSWPKKPSQKPQGGRHPWRRAVALLGYPVPGHPFTSTSKAITRQAELCFTKVSKKAK